MRKEHIYIFETLTPDNLIVKNVPLQKGQEAILIFAEDGEACLSHKEIKNLIEALQELSKAMVHKPQNLQL